MPYAVSLALHKKFYIPQSLASDMNGAPPEGHASNRRIIKALEEILEEHVAMSRDQHAKAYRKALFSIRRHSHAITTYEEAISVPNVGDKLANRIMYLNGGTQKTKACKEEEKRIKENEKEQKAEQRRLEKEAKKSNKRSKKAEDPLSANDGDCDNHSLACYDLFLILFFSQPMQESTKTSGKFYVAQPATF